MSETINITIPEDAAGARLDKVLSNLLTDYSRARLQALVKEGHIILLGNPDRTIKSPSHSVKPEESYCLTIPAAEEPIPQAENIPLEVIYEDSDLIVVNKPAGMVVHPAPGSPTGTLVNALLHHCGDSLSGIGGVKRPGIVHRIDKDTSGLLVVAKNDKAHHGLAEQFAAHTIERRYHAVCKGHPKPFDNRIEGNIGRNPHDRKKMAIAKTGGKWAATHYETLFAYQQNNVPVATHIQCQLETGRTHQVRVHMMSIGNPLVGDPIYSRPTVPGNIRGEVRTALQTFNRQALHAKSLGFLHPISGKAFKFECDLPHDMTRLLEALEPFKLG